MEQEEKNLIYHLKQGDEWAYRQLFDKHYVILCKIAYEFLKDSFMVETIVNDVIVYLWENRKNIEIKTSLRSYLIGAVRYSCMNHLQKKYVQKEISLSRLEDENFFIGLSIQSEDYPLGMLLEKELEEKIKQAITKLPKECQEVFRMSRFKNKNYEEISNELAISVNTVKYHIKNAIAKLREDLNKYLIMLILAYNFFLITH